MHSNNKNFLARFVGRIHFGVQIEIKLMTPQLTPFQGSKTSAETTQS